MELLRRPQYPLVAYLRARMVAAPHDAKCPVTAQLNAFSPKELQPFFAWRIFLMGEENYDAVQENALPSIFVRHRLLGSVHASTGQQFAGSARCGWQSRLLQGRFHRERRSRKTHL